MQMKSIHVASIAVAATGLTLTAMAVLLGTPDRLLGQSYDIALAGSAARHGDAIITAAHAPGSEHFWLTRGPDTDSKVTPAVAPAGTITIANIKQAIATAGALDADTIDIVAVREVPRATIGAVAPAGRSLLVTVKLAASNRVPARMLRFVVDAGAAPAAPARAL
jgi:hypothetical protein